MRASHAAKNLPSRAGQGDNRRGIRKHDPALQSDAKEQDVSGMSKTPCQGRTDGANLCERLFTTIMRPDSGRAEMTRPLRSYAALTAATLWKVEVSTLQVWTVTLSTRGMIRSVCDLNSWEP